LNRNKRKIPAGKIAVKLAAEMNSFGIFYTAGITMSFGLCFLIFKRAVNGNLESYRGHIHLVNS